MISDHQHITDKSWLGIIDFICPKLSFCRSPGIPVVEQEGNTDGDHACVCVGGGGGLGICGLGVKKVFYKDPVFLLPQKSWQGTPRVSAEQPGTGEGNAAKDQRFHFIHSVSNFYISQFGPGQEVTLLTVTLFSLPFFPSLNINISLHSYTSLYLELIFNYLLNQI